MFVAESFSGFVAQYTVRPDSQPVRSRNWYTSIESGLRPVQNVWPVAKANIVCEIVYNVDLIRIVVILVGALIRARNVHSVLTNTEASGYDGMAKP